MKIMRYRWEPQNVFEMVLIPGTHGHPFPFGERPSARSVEIQDFFIGTVPVTRGLWLHVMGAKSNPDVNRSLDVPVENTSWDQITQPGGFLDRINQSAVHASEHAGAVSAAYR
jgi:formylglycine-generating enzyme required for sulfatase activity